MALFRMFALTVLGALGLGLAPLQAIDPPTAEMLAQYRKDGTLQARIDAAQALGNHRVKPELVQAAIHRAQRQVMLAQGLNESQIQQVMAPPPAWRGLPTKGAPKILVMLVDFPDYPALVDATTIQSKLFVDDGTDANSWLSLRKFYRLSSYSQLDLNGNVLGYYRYPGNKASISLTGNETTTREGIIKQTFQHFSDAGHDFAQYDNSGTGVLDYFVVIWTGPNNGWSGFWWAYQTDFQDQTYTVNGKRLSTYVWSYLDQAQSNSGGNPAVFYPRTLIHETGHALGLPDYYDYDDAIGPKGGVGGLDMMDWNIGDHNAFSKWMLDWLTPTPVTSAQAALSLRPKSEVGAALAIMPTLPSASSPFGEYFLVENRQRTKNDSDPNWPTSGLMIWHVDATLNTARTNFLYDNSYTSHKLLRLMEADGLEEIENGDGRGDGGDFWNVGKHFGPITLPNSTAYNGTDTNVGVKNITSATPNITLDVTFDPPLLTLLGISPSSGVSGTAVALSGNGFTGATSVRFNGVSAAFTVLSDTRISTAVPVGASTGRVAVTTAEGTVLGGTFTLLAPLSITGFSPSHGGAGTLVTVTGAGFTGLSNLRLGSTPGACISLVSDTQVGFYVSPAHTTGVVSITSVAGTATSSLPFTVDPPPAPTLLSFLPGVASVGETIQISGTGLFREDTTVAFKGSAALAPTFLCAGTSLSVAVPPGAATGPITVYSPRGNATSLATFVLRAPATVTSFAPASGSVGSAVTVRGTSFTGATRVTFQDVSAPFSVVSDTELQTTVPTGALTGKITVTNPTGSGTSASDFIVIPNVLINEAFTGCVLGFSKTFTATVTGSLNTAITWSSQPAGLINTSGVFTAPTTASTVTLIATSVVDPTRSARLSFPIRGRNLAGGATLTVLDMALLSKYYGAAVTSASAPEAVCDLNGDGVIDDADITLFFAGF